MLEPLLDQHLGKTTIAWNGMLEADGLAHERLDEIYVLMVFSFHLCWHQ